MHLVSAHPPGAPIGVHRCLTPTERAALVAHFRGGVLEPLTTDLLRWASRVHLWIACDCRARQDPPPILFVQHSGVGEFTLTRMLDRPAHHSQCPFALPPASLAAARPIPLNPLGALLFRWFSAAKLNVVYPYEGADLVHDQFVSLRETSKSLEIARGRRLFDHSRTHPVGLPGLMRQLTARLPGMPGPGAVYFGTVPALTADALRAALHHPAMSWSASVPLDTLNHISLLPGAASDAGPHAVLFGFEYASAQSQVRIEGIFAQPIFSRGQLVPVNAAHERRTLAILLSVQREMLRTHGVVVAIRKTLPDTPLYERGVAFQIQRLGPNGRAARTLDVLSVDCEAAPRDAFAIASDVDLIRDEALWSHARTHDTLYHFVQLPADIKLQRRPLAEDLMDQLMNDLRAAGARRSGSTFAA